MNKWIAVIPGALLLWALVEFGARKAETDMHFAAGTATQAAITAQHVTTFCKYENVISLSGIVPDNKSREAFLARARNMFRHSTIENGFVVRAVEGRRELMEKALVELGQLDSGCISLKDNDLLISGTIRSERALIALKNRMAEIDDPSFTAQYDLTILSRSIQAQTCQDEANKRVSRDELMLFTYDSDKVHEIGRQILDEIVEISALCPDAVLSVTGHTDEASGKGINAELGLRRAEAVVAYMIKRGVDAKRMAAIDHGYSQPIADNSTETGRTANRRIEFRAN